MNKQELAHIAGKELDDAHHDVGDAAIELVQAEPTCFAEALAKLRALVEVRSAKERAYILAMENMSERPN